jgi:PIN domain nuclease of toxin-antitoxin system
LSRLGLLVMALDEEQAMRAGFLRASTRAFGLSLGDRACLAQARHLGLPVVTADQKWKDLDVGVEVLVIR